MKRAGPLKHEASPCQWDLYQCIPWSKRWHYLVWLHSGTAFWTYWNSNDANRFQLKARSILAPSYAKSLYWMPSNISTSLSPYLRLKMLCLIVYTDPILHPSDLVKLLENYTVNMNSSLNIHLQWHYLNINQTPRQTLTFAITN